MVKTKALLHYVLEHAVGDERPYLTVETIGQCIFGFLDFGTTCTILGSKGWKILSSIGLKLNKKHQPDTAVSMVNASV